MTTSVRAATDDALRMRHLLYGHLLSRALVVVAELGIPDLLADRAATAAELAERTGSNPVVLEHLLRSLCAFEVFGETEPGRFALTPLGATLRADAPATARPTALLLGGEVGAAWDGLAGTVRSGRPAFDRVHGIDFFGYLGAHRRFREVFDASQAAGVELESETLVHAVDFGSADTIVDVGGGDGTLLAAILAAHPRPRGVLFDLDSVVSAARRRLTGAPVAHRIDCVGGDFDASVPPGGDLYLLRHIVHDWPDDRCVAILRRCRDAVIPGGRVVIVDRVAGAADAGDEARMTALMTLYMLTVVEGRERTAAEFGTLLDRAGLTLDAVVRVAGDTVALVARPGPRPR
ncbi:methyltransferase [Nocardia terpenica]|uniref:methyltransferase n=1 Tax=Nocardia terpenica TaxID=455432 RepID=UPI00189398EF|nr:methyltransferase [Nocardia terpenica]MBF6061286.1 methyltransferase [Nocardia terpenica]MBF6105485.1 methyltransferase [Nocardia terpenica]MBF6113045.1 methyltransferase [Nocardia terpenica]MBF6119175.1 methyltransferase [Nocardia terpenica]MBF6152823.1 methyltransferase [Nocardia terpenica]